MKEQVVNTVVSRIAEIIERGVLPWTRPCLSQGPPLNFASGKPYRGVNHFVLGLTECAMGYDSPYWLTFKQALDAGGNVRKGEKGSPIAFWTDWTPKGEDPEETKIPVLRLYHAFNARQIDGIDFPIVNPAMGDRFGTWEAGEAILTGYRDAPMVVECAQRASYLPCLDEVWLPRKEFYSNQDAYYKSLFHELVHSTGHATRLHRDLKQEPGTPGYAKEELLAELGAALICSHTGIFDRTQESSASYLFGWAKAIGENPMAFMAASGAAQKAVDWILGTRFSI